MKILLRLADLACWRLQRFLQGLRHKFAENYTCSCSDLHQFWADSETNQNLCTRKEGQTARGPCSLIPAASWCYADINYSCNCSVKLHVAIAACHCYSVHHAACQQPKALLWYWDCFEFVHILTFRFIPFQTVVLSQFICTYCQWIVRHAACYMPAANGWSTTLFSIKCDCSTKQVGACIPCSVNNFIECQQAACACLVPVCMIPLQLLRLSPCASMHHSAESVSPKSRAIPFALEHCLWTQKQRRELAQETVLTSSHCRPNHVHVMSLLILQVLQVCWGNT